MIDTPKHMQQKWTMVYNAFHSDHNSSVNDLLCGHLHIGMVIPYQQVVPILACHNCLSRKHVDVRGHGKCKVCM